MKHIVVIGGGITGLAAAHRLLERSHELRKQIQVTLIEAGSRVGGIVQTQERDGFLLEQGPDSFISEKPSALELVRRLGIESRLIETNENHRRSLSSDCDARLAGAQAGAALSTNSCSLPP